MVPTLYLSRGRSQQVNTSRFVSAAAELLADESQLGSPPKPRLNRGAAVAGPPLLDDIDCTLICTPETRATLSEALLSTFTAQLSLGSTEELDAWAATQLQSVFQAACVAGPEAAWEELAVLAARGIGVSFLPTPVSPSDPARPNSERPTSQSVNTLWVVAPDDDPYTEAIAQGILPTLKGELERINRKKIRLSLQLSTPSAPSDDAIRSGAVRPSLVILLTHGDDDGYPQLSESWQAQTLQDAARGGAFVVHLGCYGAGKRARSPFAPLAQLLELDLSSPHDGDIVAPFCLDLLALGAKGVLAHVGETWSTCFVDSAPFAKLLAWLGSGRPVVSAISSLHEDANRLHGIAHDALRRNDTEVAAHAWLRSLDLRQFVLLGRPLVSLPR